MKNLCFVFLLFVVACKDRVTITAESPFSDHDTSWVGITYKQAEKILGPMYPVRIYNISEEISRLRDSIVSTGVDTIISFYSHCRNCKNYVKIIPGDRLPISWSEPGYLFWKKAGSYYVLKVDQFGISSVMQCESFLSFPLYDYYFRNSTAIQQSNVIRYEDDTTGYSVFRNDSNTRWDTSYLISKRDLDYVHQMPAGQFPDYGELSIKADTTSFNTDWEEYFFWPVAGKGRNANGSVYGNDEAHYILNRELPVYRWIELIREELLLLDSDHQLETVSHR